MSGVIGVQKVVEMDLGRKILPSFIVPFPRAVKKFFNGCKKELTLKLLCLMLFPGRFYDDTRP